MAPTRYALGTQYQLDTLPVEIIRRIASNGPCRSALSLLQTSRRLRAAVDDWTVFQAIISNDADGPQKRSKWDLSALPEGSGKDFFARYAFADQMSKEFLDSPGDVKLSRWAPQLMAMHLNPRDGGFIKTPFDKNFMPDPLLSYDQVKHIATRIQKSLLDEAVALLFSRAACAMSHRFDLFPGAVIPEASRLEFYNDLFGGHHEEIENSDPKRTLFECDIFPWITNENHWPRFHDPNNSLVQLLSLAYEALPMIYYELLRAISEDKVGQGGRYPPGVIPPPLPPNPPPPTSSQVPFSAFMALPLPFSADCATEFNACHLQSMCTAGFIEMGSWIGYHLMVAHDTQEPANFFRPIDGMQFSVGSEQIDIEGTRLRSNEGFVDLMGNFSFELILKEGEGLFELTKAYRDPGNIDLPFQGIMTPFGIVATFGVMQPRNARQTHWLWLWKSEWLAKAATF